MKGLTLPSGTTLKGINNTYTIEKVLGQGSFGITYLGITRMKLSGPLGTIDTDVKVAIKEFFMSDINGRSSSQVTCSSQGGQYEYYRHKFKSEAESLSRLKHENIINVLESFEANNTVYYVMEYVGGGSLNDHISRKGRLGEKETVGIALQICSALSYMHGRRMLHLDLKPGNVMLHDDGRAVLIDFGLAKQFDSSGNPESSTTIGHGTPGYAPLEQSNYNEDRHRGFPCTMDIYALGGTMFKMLTGKCPPLSSDILNEGFPAYELQDSGAGEEIIGIISRAMSPMVGSRYQSADEMAKDLHSILITGGHVENTDEATIPGANSNPDEKPTPRLKEKELSSDDHPPVKRETFNRLQIFSLCGILLVILLFLIFGMPSHDENDIISDDTEQIEESEHSSLNIVHDGIISGHEYVDLGLSVKWATCNVGSSSPEEYGDYYAWGETSTKSEYTEENSITYDKKFGDISGNSQYDAARYNWGGSWRLPTELEINELCKNCDYKWTTYKGKKGGLFTSKKNGKKLFLPAAGYRYGTSLYRAGEVGYYWSSTPYEVYDGDACCIRFFANGGYWDRWNGRFGGRSVRPVSE